MVENKNNLLTSDCRNVEDKKMVINWNGLDSFKSLAFETISSCKKLINDTMKANNDDKSQNILKGALLSIQDIESKVNKISNSHNLKFGTITSEDFDEYSTYLELGSAYGMYTEEAATLLGTVYANFFESAEKNATSEVVKKQAKKSGNEINKTLADADETSNKEILGKLDGK